MIYKIHVCVNVNPRLNINCVLILKGTYKIQNQDLEEMLSKAFDRKQTIQNFSGHHKKNDLIVLEPKPPLIGCYLRNRCDTPEPYGNI